MTKIKTKNKKTKKTKKLKNLTLVIAILIIIISPFAFFYIYYLGRIYPNIFISGINLSGQTQQEAINLVNPTVNLPNLISLKYNDKTFDIDINSLEISFDKEKPIKSAYLLGRSGNVLLDIKSILFSLKTKTEFPLEIKANETYLDNKISEITNKINIEPLDAKFTITNGKVENFSLEASGLKVNTKELKEEVLAKIHENNSSAITLNIPTEIDHPKIITSDINNLGIKELVGSGTSHFAGSISSRIYNINLAASRIDNTLIAPGDIFSFNQTVRDISALNGYKQAYVIQNGQTVLGDGGGVCQVSTTMFRAAMNSGLPIVERHAHAYRVHYYEEDAAPGFDATIYTPSVDFKFKNETANYILIQTQIDLKNLTLTFNLYGTKDGRVVTITKPTLWDYKPAPSDSYADDPTLAIGTIKQVDFAASGIKSTFDYTVTKNSEVINKQTFYSNFEPWQAKFLRGTKI